MKVLAAANLYEYDPDTGILVAHTGRIEDRWYDQDLRTAKFLTEYYPSEYLAWLPDS